MRVGVGLRFISAVVNGDDLTKFVRMGKLDHLFDEHEKEVFDFVLSHAMEHGTLPHADTVAKHATDLPEVNEPPSYYLDQLRNRYIDRGLHEAIDSANEHMRAGPNKDPRAAMAALTAGLYEIQKLESGEGLFDIRDAYEPVFTLHSQTQQGLLHGVNLGWPSLDGAIGGARGGDLVSFVGRPGKGKTWMMLYAANHAREQGKVALFLTMEMKAVAIQQRLAAMIAGVPGKQLHLGQLTNEHRQRMKEALLALKTTDTPLHILEGGMQMQVDRLRMITKQMKPDIVFVDGAYMLKHPDKTLKKWGRIDAVCEDLKDQMSMDLDIPVVASWQYNREKLKKGDESQLTLDDIYGSDTISFASSIVLGLFQKDNVENAKIKMIHGQKVREAPPMRFEMNWDFYGMNFNEIPKPERNRPPEGSEDFGTPEDMEGSGTSKDLEDMG